MALNYERIGWENAPSTNTPIDAGSLNHMDNGILAVSNQYDADVPYLQEQVAGIPAMLDSYLAEQIDIDVANWLDEHVTPGGSTVVVDDTLTIEGAAAESKTVGDALAIKASQSDVDDLESAMSEVETTLATKANTSDVNAALATKADTEDLNEAVEDIDELQGDVGQLKNALIVSNASGAIASFPDGGDGFPVRDLKVQMEPIQDLQGYDHPWPAGGGKNKFDKNYLSNFANYTQLISGYQYTGKIQLKPNTNYIIKAANTSAMSTGLYYVLYHVEGSDPDSISPTSSTLIYPVYNGNVSMSAYQTFTTGETGVIRFAITNASNLAEVMTTDWQLEEGSTATAWSPYSNVCPISGRTAVNVTRTGFNVWDEEYLTGYYNSSGVYTSQSGQLCTKNKIRILPNTSYYLGTVDSLSVSQTAICYYDINETFINRIFQGKGVFTTPNNAYYMTVNFGSSYGDTYNHDISINYPSTDTDYHAGHVQTVTLSLGQTVYGGTLDVTQGVLTVDRAIVDLGTLDWSYGESNLRFGASLSGILPQPVTTLPRMTSDRYKVVTGAYFDSHTSESGIIRVDNSYARINVRDLSYSDATTFTNAVTGSQLAYEIAQPVEVQLTAQQMTTLLGQNNVLSDADSVSVDYVADTKLYIAKVIADALS